ncbi:MAG: sulfatase-like hydrolase/transferase, partial [Bryobacterales bacterium]|nr:sulfatase-like hydrolase/transferase [Bryobacterales bacterium]
MTRRVLVLLAACLVAIGCSTQSTAERPNILFAIWDDVSYPHVSAAGSKMVNTPAFDRVAAEGTLF